MSIQKTHANPFFSSDVLPVLSLVVVASSLFFLNLGASPFRNLETKWAEIVKEMVRSGDYITPTINGVPYLDKPNLSYWLMVISAGLFGGVNELTVRIPVALSGVLSVVFLYGLGKRLFDRPVGWMAAWILATAYFYIFWGRSGSADTMTVCGELLTLWIFVRFKDSPGRAWLYFFYASMSLNSLSKGLLGFALPLLVVLPYSLWTRQWRWLFNRTTIPAGVVALLIYLLPFAVSFWQTGSYGMMYKVYRENIQRFFNPFDHYDNPVYFYFYDIFRFFAPWSVFLPFALYAYLRPTAMREEGVRFTAVFLVVLFAFFSASGSRRSYYILPAVPAAALFVARWWKDIFETEGRLMRRLSAMIPLALFWLVLLSCAALLAAGPLLSHAPLPQSLEQYRADLAAIEWPPLRGWAAGGLAAAGFWTFVNVARDRRWGAFLTSAAAVALAFAYYAWAILPIEAKYLTAKPFDVAVRAHMGEGREIVFYRFTNTREVYYIEPPVRLIRDEERLIQMANKDELAYLLAQNAEVPRLLEALPGFRVILSEPYQPFRRKSDKTLVFLGRS